MMAAAAHTRLLMAPSNLRLFLASPCLGRAFVPARAGLRPMGSIAMSRHLRWRAVGGVVLPRKSGTAEPQRRYVHCVRSSVQAETAVHVENSDDVVAGSLESRNAPTFQQAIQRLQVGVFTPFQLSGWSFRR